MSVVNSAAALAVISALVVAPPSMFAQNAVTPTPDGSLDSDGDGVSNRDEYQTGTNPHDGRSVFRITRFEVAGQGFRIQFNTVPGRRYEVEETQSLGPEAVWEAAGDVVYAQGPTATVNLPKHPLPRGIIYRVRLLEE